MLRAETPVIPGRLRRGLPLSALQSFHALQLLKSQTQTSHLKHEGYRTNKYLTHSFVNQQCEREIQLWLCQLDL